MGGSCVGIFELKLMAIGDGSEMLTNTFQIAVQNIFIVNFLDELSRFQEQWKTQILCDFDK